MNWCGLHIFEAVDFETELRDVGGKVRNDDWK